MTPLRVQALSYLKGAGWHPDRKWEELPAARASVHAEGFRTSEAAASFLREFGGLTVWHHLADGQETKTSFDPVEAAQNLDSLWQAEYEEEAQVPVSIVGEAHDGTMTIFLGDDGRVFVMSDQDVTCIGQDVGDGLNSLFAAGPSSHVDRARRDLERKR